jgi:PAS domain S-box-containing protein
MNDSEPRRLVDRLLSASRGRLLWAAAVSIVCTAWLDWYAGEAVTLGALYILPILLLSTALTRGQLLCVALLCAVLRLLFNPHPTVPGLVLNFSFALVAYGVIAVSGVELARNRREILGQLHEIRRQQALRREAEEQLRLLAESSPAAIFTLDGGAAIVSANRATRELLGLAEDAEMVGRNVSAHLPVLAEALKFDTGDASFRTVSQVQGARADGSPFLAQACFSTYRAANGEPRLAAIAFDSTEDTREREEQSQEQLHESHRIIAGAVAHEVRNVCSAMNVVYANLDSAPGMRGNRDFEALGGLLDGLRRLADMELDGRAGPRAGSADLRDVLSQLRVLIEPGWEEAGGRVVWPELARPLLVAADSFSLLQAFFNLAVNSLTAVAGSPERALTVSVEELGPRLHVAFADTGPGVADPSALFQPFRSGSGSVGIGLYVSRALLRRFGGDVRYQASGPGARFIVEVPLHGMDLHAASGRQHASTAPGR